MKYIDAEKLIAEIERLNSLVSYESKDRHDEGLHDAYKAVKNVIASFQQEQQEEVDLAENIEMEWDSFNKHLAKYDEGSVEVVWLSWVSFVDIATYFYKLGRKQVLQEIYDGKTKPVDKITAAWLDDKEEDK